MHPRPLEDSDPPCTQLAWFPIEQGRIEVSGARCANIALSGAGPSEDEGPGRVLDRRFLIAWSAEDLVPFLDEVFGGGPKPWFRRTIDVRRLASEADRLAEDESDPEASGLVSAARRYRVPGQPPADALDAALITAELFLVLATRLAAEGFRDVGSLLGLTNPSPLRGV